MQINRAWYWQGAERLPNPLQGLPTSAPTQGGFQRGYTHPTPGASPAQMGLARFLELGFDFTSIPHSVAWFCCATAPRLLPKSFSTQFETSWEKWGREVGSQGLWGLQKPLALWLANY